MLTMSGPPTVGASWFDRKQATSSWSSLGFAMLATLALFASAAITVRSAPTWFETRSPIIEPPVVLHLAPPLAVPVPRTAPAPTPARARARETAQPTTVAPTIAAPTPVPIGVRAESASTAPPAPPKVIPLSPVPPTAPFDTGAVHDAIIEHIGVPTHPRAISHPSVVVTPAGITEHVPLTKAKQDSLLAAASAAWAADLKKPIDGEARGLIDQSQRNQAMLHTSATGAGGGSGYTAGKGMDGVGTVQPGSQSAGAGGATNTTLLSIPFPLFYPGPSPAQRKRDSIVNADNLARLTRLRARVESLRLADSLAKVRADSIAKIHIIP